MKNEKKVTEKVVSENQTAQVKVAGFPFDKSRFTLMLIGLAIMISGFFIMTLDKEPFGFGFMGLTLGPILAFLGLMFQFYPILKK